VAKRILAIDDMRECKGATVLARTYQEGLDLLFKMGPWDELWIDHDLASYDAEGREKTGYDILCHLEALWPTTRVDTIVLLTSNSSGRLRMIQVMENFLKFPHPLKGWR
jgi:hypothetical protein